nr:MAG TPA: major capsid protein [Caudoviricetes sp.]
MITKKLILLPVILNLFDGNTNVTTDPGLSDEMKTFYSDYLIDLAQPELVHDQFGQKHPIPKNGGKTIEFRKYNPLPKALKPLTEGVTPDGGKLSMSVITAKVEQYGFFVEISDVLLLTAIDNNLVQATQQLGRQAGSTLDTITRETLNGGTNVQYGEGQVDSRSKLYYTSENDNCNLTVNAIRKAVRFLKVMNTPRINGDYVGIIHPDCSYDLMNDPKWVNVKTYSDPKGIYEGEIGKIEGVRFVETSEAKIFSGDNLASDSRTLLVNGQVSASKSITFDGGTVAAGGLVGRKILIGDVVTTVEENTTTTMTVKDNVTAADNAVIYPGEAGKGGRGIYSTLILGANAYGITEIEGGGLQHIVKQLGSAGSADPLDQRATAGWKAIRAVERLIEPYMIRIETTSTFDGVA